MSENIDDLSYSGLSSLINGGDIVGGNVIDKCAKELVALRMKIEVKEKELNKLKSRMRSLTTVPKKTSKILNLELPFFIIKNDYIIIVKEEDLIIENNIIKI